MPYNLVADSFHTKKLCSRYSSSEVRFYTENGRFVFLSTPHPWGLRGSVRCSSYAHWKALSRLPISDIWIFSRVTALHANIDWNRRFCSNGVSLPHSRR